MSLKLVFFRGFRNSEISFCAGIFFVQLFACDIPKCGFSNWVQAFYHIENEGDEFNRLSKDVSIVFARAKELFRISNKSHTTISQEEFDESLKVCKCCKC